MFVCKDCHDNLHLKSNMDRFIGTDNRIDCSNNQHLKSNMDRFIVSDKLQKKHRQVLI